MIHLKEMTLCVDLNLLSKYRTPLMGLAALMVIFCHAPYYGVVMPRVVHEVLGRGNLGVDIFLFLSGIGCWYSLFKGVSLKQWYYRRFVRIFIPYLLMQIPFWIWKLCNGEFSLSNEVLVFSTAGFWLNHVGAWYVALLVPLYLLTPPIYKILQFGNRLLLAGLLVVGLTVVCMWNIDMLSGSVHAVIDNLQWAFRRVPSYVIGMAVAPMVKRGVKVNALAMIVLPLALYIAIHTLISKDTPVHWCLVIPILTVLVIFLTMLKDTGRIYRFISWMGIVSLESYLANIYLSGMIKDSLAPLRNDCLLLTGGYFEYALVIVLGMLLSWMVSSMSKLILTKQRGQSKTGQCI